MSMSPRYLALSVLLMAVGCRLVAQPDIPEPNSRAEVEAKKKLGMALPPGERAEIAIALSKITTYKLEDAAGVYPLSFAMNPRRITLENELAYRGVRVADDGKLRDRTGKEIYIDVHYGMGIPPPNDYWEQQRRTMDALRKTHTIVVIDLDPYHMAP